MTFYFFYYENKNLVEDEGKVNEAFVMKLLLAIFPI